MFIDIIDYGRERAYELDRSLEEHLREMKVLAVLKQAPAERRSRGAARLVRRIARNTA